MNDRFRVPDALALSMDFLKSMKKSKDLPPEQLEEWASRAIQIGEEEAKNYANTDILSQVKKDHIRIELQEGGVFGNNLLRALYDDTVKSIVIYKQGLESVLETPAADILGIENSREKIMEVLVCHEYFHYIELSKRGLVGENFKLDQKVLWFQTQKPVYYVSEISANAFAQKVLNLKENPFVFDYLLHHQELWKESDL